MSKQVFNNQASSPGTPAAGKLNQWSATANKRFWFTDENGVSGPIGIPYTTYYVDDYGVTPANSAATNVTNLNTLLQTTAADKSRIQFGSGTYSFNAGLTTLTKDFAFVGVRGMTTIAITAAMGASTNFINCSNAGYYTSFRDLNWVNFSAQTSNYVIGAQNNVNVEILDCFFTGAAAWAGVLDFTGTNSGNGAILKNVYIANFAGIAINVASPLDTMYVEDLEIIGNANNTTNTGLNCTDGGAMLMSNSQIINCNINVQLNPSNTKTVSAIFAVNCFFDQGRTNCMLITGAGTGTVARCHFIGCWFTISATGSNVSCIQITTAGSGIHAGVQFQDCEIMNATPGSTGTLIGINATSIQDFTVSGCQFAGWTTDITVTPASAGTCSPTITANTFTGWGLIAASTNGITLNAGSFVYGPVNIQGNTMSTARSTNITNNATVTAPNEIVIRNNPGTGRDVYSARMTATQTVGTALADITGLSFILAQPNLSYSFDASIISNSSTTTAAGVGIAINLPAGATLFASAVGPINNSTAFKNTTFTAVNTAQTGYNSVTTSVLGAINIRGTITAGAATSQTGTVQFRANNASTGTIQLGSFVFAKKTN